MSTQQYFTLSEYARKSKRSLTGLINLKQRRADFPEPAPFVHGVEVYGESDLAAFLATVGPWNAGRPRAEVSAAEAYRLYENGMSVKDIAVKYDVTPMTVYRRIREYREDAA